ncbi:MAG: M48 family metallopeptidase [Candidatus Omnitrophica bacterium]|nr:M48 family metallopeptidase [Candidatus Omnitrophota bacterium]
MDVKIVRSRKRRRTVSARMVKGALLINAPELISDSHLNKLVADFKVKFEKKRIKDELDKKENLFEVAARLNQKYFGNKLKVGSIEYVTGQSSKFGCCNYRTSQIRISHRVGLMPVWVRDYVLIHELAHLIEPNHSKRFWDIVLRYKLAERAKGFLMATGFEIEQEVGYGNQDRAFDSADL